ncbi:MAG: hypothetical protein ACQEXX_00075 [Bacillota bacterium]
MNVIWRKEWLHEYESPWSVFEKLALVNLADRNEILQVFGNAETQSIKHNIGDKRRDLLELNGFNHELIQQTLDINLKEHNQNIILSLIKPFSGLYSSWEHWFHNELHWCSECIKRGYHSWFHQFKLLDECVFHGGKLINSCPDCKETIPFLLTNKQLDHAFMCKCGHLLANLHSSSWKEWRGPDCINQDVLNWLQNNLNEIKRPSKWIIHAQHCNLKLLIKGAPEETYIFDEFDPIHQHQYYSSRFQNDLLRVCSAAFQKVEEGLLKSILLDHRHCISQLMELKKTDRFADFPIICPYAYAYVFWRKSLLKEEYFYCDNLCRTMENNSFYRSPLIIRDHLEYFADQIVSHQMSVLGGIHPNSLFWVLEKIVTKFSDNFFKAWLSIAGKRSQETSVPRWDEIEKMRDLCFPNIAFNYAQKENGSSSSIEFYHLASKQSVIQCNCPYQGELSKEAIQSMISYTPQRIAMFVMSNPVDENIQLQKSVDLYVKKLNF